MGLVNRWYDIIHYLLIDQKTVSELANHLGLSNKTVERSIELLNDELSHIMHIHCESDYLTLRVIDKVLFQNILNGKLKKESDYNSSTKRTVYILRHLIYQTDYQVLTDFSEALMVSRTTIGTDMKEAKKWAEAFRLTIESVPNRGVKLVGDEFQKRLLYLNRIQQYFECDYVTEATMVFFQQLQEQYQLNYEVIQYLVHIVDVLIRSISNGKQLMCPIGYYTNISAGTELFNHLLEHIETEYQVTLSQYEQDFLSFPFNFQNNHLSQEVFDLNNPIVRRLFNTMMTRVHQKFMIGIDAEALYESMFMHVLFLINRAVFQMPPRAIFSDQISHKYPLAYAMAKECIESMAQDIDKSISPLEVDYLALHIELAKKEVVEKSCQKVAIVTNSGYGTANIIKQQIERVIGANIEVKFFSDKDYRQIDVKHYQAIFTTLPVLDIETSVPVIAVNHIFNESWLSAKWRALSVTHMNVIDKYIHKVVKLDASRTYSELIGDMLHVMEVDNQVDCDYRQDMQRREAEHPTIFDHGIAFPHGVNRSIQTIQLVVGVLDDKMTVKDKAVKLIFMLAVPEDITQPIQNELISIYDYVFQLAQQDNCFTVIDVAMSDWIKQLEQEKEGS